MIQIADLLGAALDTVRPLEVISPSEWAERHRVVAGGPFAGKWDNTNGPYLVGIMDAVQEALERNLQGVVCMKSNQGAGTDALGVNCVAWLLHYFPGPVLYLTNKDDSAREVVRDRWDPLLQTCEPLKRKHLAGKAGGELALVKRFTDAKLVLSGSQSSKNYFTNPYRFVVLDEPDQMPDRLLDGSDPVEQLIHRLDAWAEGGSTLMIAFSHPTTKRRGSGKIYYGLSDQRRGHVECLHCKAWFAPTWEDVQVFPREGQSPAAAARDPSCYLYVTPCCGVTLTEADRLAMIRHVPQRSTLSPDEARTRTWIGVHFWKFFMRQKGSIARLASEFIKGMDDEPKAMVFANQVCGDTYEPPTEGVSIEVWEKLAIPAGEEESYPLGKVPPQAQWLTSGQDSRELELHWCVWAWGLVRSQGGALLLRGWMIDRGVEEGPNSLARQKAGMGAKILEASDLLVFDQVLYGRSWERVAGGESLYVFQGLHDSGWMPTASYQYCRTKLGGGALPPQGGAYPSKGAAEDESSSSPHVTWTRGLRYRVGSFEVADDAAKRADLNTFSLKTEFLRLAERRYVDEAGAPRSRLVLPHNVPGNYLTQLASERLERDARGNLYWKKLGANHWFDCTVMAYAAAWNVAASLPQASQITQGEAALAARVRARSRVATRPTCSPARRIRRTY